MSNNAQSWLPAQALSQARVRPLIDPVVADWSRHWFAKVRASAGQAVQDDWPSAQSGPWRHLDTIGAVAFTPGTQGAVAGAMLGVRVPPQAMQQGDRSLIEILAARALDDLLERLGKLAGQSGKSSQRRDFDGVEECRWWELSLGEGGPPLRLGIRHSALVDIVKNSLPRPRRAGLSNLAEGIAKERVAIAAGLGFSTLSLGDLHQLAAGDVLVLSSGVEQPVEVLVNGSASTFVARLEADEGRPSLVLEQAE